MTVTYYHHKPRKRLRAQPARINAPAIIIARRPKKLMQRAGDPPDDPQAAERVRLFFQRMGLSAVYAKAHLPEEQK